MDPDSTRHWPRIVKCARESIRTFITDFGKLSFSRMIGSRTVKMFVAALILSELFGLLIAVLCVSFLRDYFFTGVYAVGGATAISYRSTNLIFYWVLWPLIRILGGQSRYLLGDYALFLGLGCSLDLATVTFQGSLGLLFLKITGSEFWATATATIIQMLLYIPLATLLVAGRMIRGDKTMPEPKRNWHVKEKDGHLIPGSNTYAQELALAEVCGYGSREMIKAASPHVQKELVTNPEKYVK